MYLTTDGAVTTLREISPSCLTATDPPAVCDPNPRFIAPIEMDVNEPRPLGRRRPVRLGRHEVLEHGLRGTEGCDWKKVYDTGDGHQVTALAANGKTTYAAWCGGVATRRPSAAGWRRTTAGPGTSWRCRASRTATSPRSRSTRRTRRTSTSASARTAVAGSRTPASATSSSRRTAATSWTDVTGNLPDAPVYKVVHARASSSSSAPRSGRSWRTARDGSRLPGRGSARGLPNVTVWDLTVAPDGRIVAGTHGRGDWEIKLR